MRHVVGGLLAAFALTGCVAAAQAVTPHQMYRDIRHCLVVRGAYVTHSSDPGGGFAYWGRNHSAFGRWGSWSYATKNGQVWTILSAASDSLRPKERRAFNYCTRWPR